MSTTHNVIQAVNQNNWHHAQFWAMLEYLFTNERNRKVWTQLPEDTFRKICPQLYRIIETTEEYETIRHRRELIYNVYIVIVTRIRGRKTWSQTLCNENYTFLKPLHEIYKLLLRMKTPNMTTFGSLPAPKPQAPVVRLSQSSAFQSTSSSSSSSGHMHL